METNAEMRRRETRGSLNPHWLVDIRLELEVHGMEAHDTHICRTSMILLNSHEMHIPMCMDDYVYDANTGNAMQSPPTVHIHIVPTSPTTHSFPPSGVSNSPASSSSKAPNIFKDSVQHISAVEKLGI